MNYLLFFSPAQGIVDVQVFSFLHTDSGRVCFNPNAEAGKGRLAAIPPRRIWRRRHFSERPFRHPSRRPLNTGEVRAARRPYH
jgi:hypothetical protein